jgi:hypothetical protein
MMKFNITKRSTLSLEEIFHISTDVRNFHNVMPRYFKSLHVISETETEKIILEKISFLGLTINVKTRHVIKKPNIHEVYILSGLTKGTTFIESYIETDNGTLVSINVTLKLSRVLNIFGFLEKFIAKKMNRVTDEFILASEKYHSMHLNSNC